MIELGDFTITKREILLSIAIIAILLTLGVVIGGKIADHEADANQKYLQATRITSSELFQYGMDTSVGNAFIQGNLEAIDTVTFPEIGGKYLSATKVKEKYTRHTRTVTYTDSDGHTHTRTETYWTWDYAGSWEEKAKKVRFCDIEFDYSLFNEMHEEYIETQSGGWHVRYVYYGAPIKYTGTAFANLKSGGFDKNGATFYPNMTIEQLVERLTRGYGVIMFWVFWIILIIAAVIGFYYIDNNWLEG